eukprot:9666384-Lingulodinium_polyedra.AAC.1
MPGQQPPLPPPSTPPPPPPFLQPPQAFSASPGEMEFLPETEEARKRLTGGIVRRSISKLLSTVLEQ